MDRGNGRFPYNVFLEYRVIFQPFNYCLDKVQKVAHKKKKKEIKKKTDIYTYISV